MHLFLAGEDAMVNSVDVQRLEKALPEGIIVDKHQYEGFSHATWCVGSAEAWGKWSPDVMQLL